MNMMPILDGWQRKKRAVERDDALARLRMADRKKSVPVHVVFECGGKLPQGVADYLQNYPGMLKLITSFHHDKSYLTTLNSTVHLVDFDVPEHKLLTKWQTETANSTTHIIVDTIDGKALFRSGVKIDRPETRTISYKFEDDATETSVFFFLKRVVGEFFVDSVNEKCTSVVDLMVKKNATLLFYSSLDDKAGAAFACDCLAFYRGLVCANTAAGSSTDGAEKTTDATG